jgi:DNA-binding response OmpR family regulator
MADRSRCEVLLVIVDHTEQVSLAVALQEWGYWVTVTSGFREAHERLDRHPPRVLISDVRLGAFNGLHLAVLASHLPTTAAILLDRDFDELRQAQAMQQGALYVLKPVDYLELEQRVSQLMPRPAS